MPAKAFVIAMAADIARSDYAKPSLIRARSREWLIACRWGPEGEYLSIATTGSPLDTGELQAPEAIRPKHSMIAVLASESETDATSLSAGAPIADADRARRDLLPGRWLRGAAAAGRYPSGLRDTLLA